MTYRFLPEIIPVSLDMATKYVYFRQLIEIANHSFLLEFKAAAMSPPGYLTHLMHL